MEHPRPIHPYSLLGGGENGKIHGNNTILDRHKFLFALDKGKRRYLKINEKDSMYYCRLFGGEFREREITEVLGENVGKIKLLFVQGLAGTHCNWFPQLEFFANDSRFDIVSVDLRGVGHSNSPSGRWKTSDLGKDLILLIEHLHWEKVHLIGFSLGGMASLEACLDKPNLFQSVTLISTHAGGILGTILPPWGVIPFLRTFTSLGTPTSIDNGMELLHPASYLDADVDHLDEELSRKVDECLGGNDRVTNRFKFAWQLISQARKHVESDLQDAIRLEGTLKQISAAITHHVSWERLFFLKVSGISFLVINGKQDNLVNYLNAEMVSKALGAKLLFKEDAGHGVNLHYVEEVNQALLQHIESSQTKQKIEGKRFRRLDGFPPGIHPFKTFFLALLPSYLIARRFSNQPFKKFFATFIFVSIVLRLLHGPFYKLK